jgi:hypothetical protein
MAVPYPAATAGTPGAQGFNARTGRYTYSYWVLPTIDAPTEIVLPAYDFRHGYRVRVQGAKVVSARNAPLLKLVARPKAARVRVTVLRRR